MTEYKPIGADEQGLLPPKVRSRLVSVDGFGVPTTAAGIRVATDAPIDLRMHFDSVTPPADYAPALTAAIAAANARVADGWVQKVYIPDGRWPIRSTVTITDQSVILEGPGVVEVAQNSGFLNIIQTQGAGLDGAVSRLRAKVNANSGADTYAVDSIFRPASTASIVGLKNGDLVYLDSDTKYTPAWVSVSNQSAYKGQWFPIYGIGLNVALTSGNGGIPEGARVTGLTSGATAVVVGNRTLIGGVLTNVALTFTDVVDANGAPSAFAAGETLRAQYGAINQANAATVVDRPYLISGVPLIDAHETSAQIHKITNPDMIVDIDVRLTAGGSTDAPVGTAQRKVGIQLTGVTHSKVKVWVRDGWTRVVRWQGCWMPEGDGYCVKLPNNADLTDQGYGYFFEVYGSTEFGRFTMIGRNARHAFTTNTTSSPARLTTLFSRTGVPKWNTVHDSIWAGNIDAAFDTHGGCYRTEFIDCHAVGVMGGRATTRAAAFQTRGAGTRYVNCTAEGVTAGWRIASNTFDYDWDNEIELVGCRVLGYSALGYEIGAIDAPLAPSKRTSITLRGCQAIGNGETTVDSGNEQHGYVIHSGQTVKLIGCGDGKFNASPIHLTATVDRTKFGGIGRLIVLNHEVDYAGSSATGAPLLIQQAPTEPIVVDNLVALTESVATTAPPSFWIHVLGVTGLVRLRLGDLMAPYRSNNVALFATTGGSTAANVEHASIRRVGTTAYGAAANTVVDALAPGASVTKTISVPGASVADVASVQYPVATVAGVLMESPRILAADVVSVRFVNIGTAASVAGASGTLSAIVTKRGGAA